MKTQYDAKITKTQIRFSEDIWNYITAEATRLGIAKNAVIIKIIDDYRRNQEREQSR